MEQRLKQIEKKLDEHGHKLDEINSTLQTIAVQDERIKQTEFRITELWEKYDALVDPNNGQIPKITQWQASCPRNQIKFLWWFVAVVDLGVLLAFMRLLTMWRG